MPNKYILIFYTKIDGIIKYLGIEFNFFADDTNPIFIENQLLMTNLSKLKIVLGISEEIDFSFYK